MPAIAGTAMVFDDALVNKGRRHRNILIPPRRDDRQYG